MRKKAWRRSVKRACARVIFLFLSRLWNCRSKRKNDANRRQNENETATKPGTAAYAELLKEELAAQEARKASFEQRGLAVVTTSGALAALLFGLASLAMTGKIQSLPSDAKVWLAVALVAFVCAAVLGLLTNFPFVYDAPKVEAIKGRLKEVPIKDQDAAVRDIALTRVRTLKDAKNKNKRKGRLLFGAMTLEVVAVALLAVAIWLIINP